MKRIKGIKIYIIILSLFGAVGCSDLLEQEPVSITHPDVFWTSQDNAEQALAGAYGLLKYALTNQANFLFWGEYTGMTFLDSKFWITDYIENSGDFVLAYRDASRDWTHFYRVANWANTIEQYVKGMPDEVFESKQEKDRIIGEAAFVRGLAYFYIARIWGDAPIVEESLESSSQLVDDDGYVVTIPRSDELEVLDFALAATNKSIDLLRYSSPGAEGWAITANKASAEALKAHITLWYASRDNDNGEMIQQAIDATTKVINNSGTSLIDYVAEGEVGFNRMCLGQSETGLFEINFDSDLDEAFRIETNAGNHVGATLNAPIVYQNRNTGHTLEYNADRYGNEMMNTDPDRENDMRKDLFFYSYNDNSDNFLSFLMKYSHTSQDPADPQNASAQFSESNILIFRLADMYLLRAEAYARQGNAGLAMADLNEIRSKANVPDYMGATDRGSLMKAIFDERAIEFVGEAQSGFDRIRMDYFDGVSWANQTRIEKEGYFWPVLPGVISINPAIVQTEFWRGKL
ncbi:RagB/SusD family nutrient uptake outer membrane protein [Zhouia spongiae]|uniref:RagB/SusD family nutrient uptake outer membrane protein n=1 Tax=Zhouia spongiae TaxID=2202721 RepID=A0ABY3YI33_9FLAO|nr:RagB/SusD family nutrient uptake outer membrane protein [Zhouia spongiae]UNY97299.1 RagB/SusD family nutrient uptake outer membrane protein [Zhouia spongiae]